MLPLRFSPLTEDASMITVSSYGVKLQEVLSGLDKTLDMHVYFCGFSQHYFHYFIYYLGCNYFFSPSQNPLIQPIITPRFAPSCSPELLKELGELAQETGVRIQSHICEQKPEVEYTLQLFPGHEHCASIFEKSGLLTEKVCLCIHGKV